MDQRPIGIFDSGVGGMTVFSEISKLLKQEQLIYLGDTKNFPYGNKSKETIIQISKKCVEFLLTKNVKMIIIACGTATSQALSTLRKYYDIPIIGIIEPTVEEIAKEKEEQTIGVMATAGTIRSREWEKRLKEKLPKVQVWNKACPLLAPMAEQGWTENAVAQEAIKEYLKEMKEKKLDKIILGCTHYPLFQKQIRKELGEKVEIINTGEKIATYLITYLKANQIENEMLKQENEIYLTDTECQFIEVAERIAGDKKLVIQKVEIEN